MGYDFLEPSYGDFEACLEYLEAEGFIEFFEGPDGELYVRMTEEAMQLEV